MKEKFMSPTRSDEWMMGYALGKAQGRNQERERIIKVIEDSVGNMTADVLIELIQGEQK
jgi:hypothetical protein